MLNQTIIDKMKANMRALENNVYPGRGIILGLTPDGRHYAQVYWIMGRSENSRNRIFVNENGFIKTRAFDEAKVTDPSLIIYYPVKYSEGCHIVTNGNQTDTIYDAIQAGGTFESALDTRTFEPDAPNYTPRIAGVIDLRPGKTEYACQLAILKMVEGCPGACSRYYFNYEAALPGTGHCLHTYRGDGNPLPSFTGEPYLVELKNDVNQTAGFYWDLLNEENRVSLMVKFINKTDGTVQIKVLNKLA